MNRRIAVEEAFVTAEIITEWQKVLQNKQVEPGFLKLMSVMPMEVNRTPGSKRLDSRLLDLGAGRIAHMDKTGIDVQVLSLTAPGVQVFDAQTASSLAQHANDVLAEAVQQYPTRYVGLAAVAPQDPARAAQELERSVSKLGMKGAIINSHTMGEYLDDPKYWAIFEAAVSLGVPVYLHPREPSPGMVGPFLDYGLYHAGWGFGAEAGLHAMRLIMSGVFDLFPTLKIILGHLGEGIPFFLKRVDTVYLMQVRFGAIDKLQRLPSEYFLNNFVVTTSAVTQESAIKLTFEELGPERMMFAIDYPYASGEEAVEQMDLAAFSEDDKRKIYSGNAEALFDIPAA